MDNQSVQRAFSSSSSISSRLPGSGGLEWGCRTMAGDLVGFALNHEQFRPIHFSFFPLLSCCLSLARWPLIHAHIDNNYTHALVDKHARTHALLINATEIDICVVPSVTCQDSLQLCSWAKDSMLLFFFSACLPVQNRVAAALYQPLGNPYLFICCCCCCFFPADLFTSHVMRFLTQWTRWSERTQAWKKGWPCCLRANV